MRTTNILAIILVITIIIIAYGLSRNSSEKQITTISYNNIDSLQRRQYFLAPRSNLFDHPRLVRDKMDI